MKQLNAWTDLLEGDTICVGWFRDDCGIIGLNKLWILTHKIPIDV